MSEHCSSLLQHGLLGVENHGGQFIKDIKSVFLFFVFINGLGKIMIQMIYVIKKLHFRLIFLTSL
jgi:hypothetical protein